MSDPVALAYVTFLRNFPLRRQPERGEAFIAGYNAGRQQGQLDDLRAAGWMVASHNDYMHDGARKTFWLLTNPATGRFVKGEGETDEQALDLCRAQVEIGV